MAAWDLVVPVGQCPSGQAVGQAKPLAALWPHPADLRGFGCSFPACGSIFATGRDFPAPGLRQGPKAAHVAGPDTETRRQKCRRASSTLRSRPFSPLSRPVAQKKKNMWLSSPSPSRSNRPTQANTSNQRRGPALWPAPVAARGAGSEALPC